MAIMQQRVAYAVHRLNLTVAGTHEIAQLQGVLRFHQANDAAGSPSPSAEIQVSLERDGSSAFPLKLGQAIIARHGMYCRLTWSAQSGVPSALLVVSPDPDKLDLDSTPPVLQVVGDRGASLAGAAVAVGVAAAVIVAANANRKRITISNDGANPIWIGPSTVTLANGMRLDPGDVYSSPDTAAAFYGIAAAAGEVARYLEENA